MPGKRTIRGTMLLDVDDPTWEPLLAAVGGRHAVWFMWMYEVELADKSRVHAYKHKITRRYMHLGHDGRAFEYVGDQRYREIDPDDAADLALPLPSQYPAGWDRDEDE
jgi:hypothetical protein